MGQSSIDLMCGSIKVIVKRKITTEQINFILNHLDYE